MNILIAGGCFLGNKVYKNISNVHEKAKDLDLWPTSSSSSSRLSRDFCHHDAEKNNTLASGI